MADEFPTTTLDTAAVDEGADKPKLARPYIYQAFILINQIILCANQALGLLVLDASAKVPSDHLEGMVDNDALQKDSVDARTLSDASVNFNHLKATITNNPAPPNGGADGDLYFIYD